MRSEIKSNGALMQKSYFVRQFNAALALGVAKAASTRLKAKYQAHPTDLSASTGDISDGESALSGNSTLNRNIKLAREWAPEELDQNNQLNPSEVK